MVCEAIYALAHFNSYTGNPVRVLQTQPVLRTSVLAGEWQIVLSFPVFACRTWELGNCFTPSNVEEYSKEYFVTREN